ncbi:hypothetical protein K503DRAFT_378008 [Rhizopogon vinicolor AM-OR11-026]|uniref:F-box domain-containing protein n=1 Tax=Rhizopogon vinicolor AM-OR11-026 TaxID=1314800 RepID=A0A1B7MRT9_9AGAM|nr:hypothetical protein K503DRAFT_378008 [Rhizopogon vinicolor AM-OR11-026]
MRHVHVCLLPTEILLVIFTIIREEPGTRDSLKRKTIAALARTCRTFKEPALDVLWEKSVESSHLSHSCLKESFQEQRSESWNVRFLSCRSVVLSIDWDWMDPDEPYDPLDIPDLIVAFSECFSPVLEQIQVDTKYGYDNESIMGDHRFAFGFGVIAPLLQFSRLTKLDLDGFCTSDVDDKAFKNMV